MITGVLSDHFSGYYTTEILFDKVLVLTVANETFQLVHEVIHVFLCVHLLTDVYWVSIPVLEGSTEVFRVKILF